jgi:hypothetical protein
MDNIIILWYTLDFFKISMLPQHLWPRWPDWANFRPVGDGLLRAVFVKLKKSPKILDHFFPSLWIICDEKLCWATFWATLSHTHLVTLPLTYATCTLIIGCCVLDRVARLGEISPDFSCTIYQNNKNIPNDHKIYQTATKYTKLL